MKESLLGITRSPVEQIGEILHHDVGAVFAEGLGLSHAVHADHDPETASPTGGHAGLGILEYGAILGCGVKELGAVKEGVGSGLPR